MGLSFSFLKDWWLGQQDFRILMTGLDNAGKTTMLYKLSLGEVIHTIPTIGFNVETINYRNVSFNVWDLGGQKKIRVLWHYYYFNCQAIIFVVDSTDYYRFDEVKEELQTMLFRSQIASSEQQIRPSHVQVVFYRGLGTGNLYPYQQGMGNSELLCQVGRGSDTGTGETVSFIDWEEENAGGDLLK